MNIDKLIQSSVGADTSLLLRKLRTRLSTSLSRPSPIMNFNDQSRSCHAERADGLLLKTTMPATLAETVFITSDAEHTLLTDGTGNRQQQIAQHLLQGINTWFGV